MRIVQRRSYIYISAPHDEGGAFCCLRCTDARAGLLLFRQASSSFACKNFRVRAGQLFCAQEKSSLTRNTQLKKGELFRNEHKVEREGGRCRNGWKRENSLLSLGNLPPSKEVKGGVAFCRAH